MIITPEIVLKAYALGVFPMAESREDEDLHWIDPNLRGILPLDDFHLPRRLAKTCRQGRFTVRIDHAFRDVTEACAEATALRPGTWINRDIVDLYSRLHDIGHAHSVECWRDGRLVGGLYGVSLGAAFFGESMFSRERDASKVALVHLVMRLRYGGFELLDTQFVTPHLRQFGAIDIAREAYHQLLGRALARAAAFPAELPQGFEAGFLHSMTQTS